MQTKINSIASLQIVLNLLGLKQEIVKNRGYMTSGEACVDLTSQAIAFIERLGF